MFKRNLILAISALLVSTTNFAQKTLNIDELNGKNVNRIASGVPFLTIDPESRGGAMGDVGVATSPDINSMYWNPAKYAFIESDAGISVSYTPWLRNLVGDIDLGYVSAFYRVNKEQVVAASLRYFSLGEIQLTDDKGEFQTNAKPNELSFDATYSRLFSEHFSGAMAFRYIRSDLSKGTSNYATSAGQSFAADLGLYYNHPVMLSDKKGKLSFGMNISNIGTKLTYSSDAKEKIFLPTNLRLGGALSADLDENNSLTLAIDANKLLVPDKPEYLKSKLDITADSTVNNVPQILYGKDANVGVLTGMLQSFYDSPGLYTSSGKRSVLKGELSEVTYSVGLEYWYRKQFALRTGYFHESEFSGNRKFYTMGVGLKLNVFAIDFSYLLANSNNPLANTLRFTLSFDFDAFNKLKNQ